MTKTLSVTNNNFAAEVQNYPGTVLLFFDAPWDLIGVKSLRFLSNKENPEYKLCVVNYDEERELTQKFSIRKIPNIYVIKAGQTITSVSTCEDETSLQKLLGEV